MILLPGCEVGGVPVDVGVARPDVVWVLRPRAVDIRPEAQWVVVRALRATDAVVHGRTLDKFPLAVIDVDAGVDEDVAGRGVVDGQVPSD